MNDTSHYDKCRTLMNIHKARHQKRTIFFSVLTLMNLYLAIALPVKYHLSLIYGNFLSGITFGLFVFIYGAGLLALLLFSIPEKPKLLILTILLIISGIMLNFIHLIVGIPMLVICLSQIPDCRQAVWIQKQDGYPYFNERFDEQMQYFGKEYQPDHALDNLHDAEMLDIPEESTPDFTVSPKTEMPEIPDISEFEVQNHDNF
ncbi:MAG: hypothetical protein E7496_05195 [Ruminococcus sp.]|nr:hypothetical protein [Ruminococcus sp.]